MSEKNAFRAIEFFNILFVKFHSQSNAYIHVYAHCNILYCTSITEC